MLIYDLEIEKAIPDRGRREEGVEYCAGWEDHAGMGLAVAACYDYKTERTRVFCRDNLDAFFALLHTHECIVGFNNRRFDDRIVEALGYTIPPQLSYDILREVYRGLGVAESQRPPAGYGLEPLSRVNFNASKDGDGRLAPVLWQRGAVGTVIDYCLRDLHLTKKLLDRIIRAGRLIDPNSVGNLIAVRKPGSYA